MFGRGQAIFSLTDSSSTIRRQEESICKIIPNLLVISSDSASIRKEPLVSLTHVLGTGFKISLSPLLEALLDERVLTETGGACSESLRPLAYNLLAEIIHHSHRDLSLSQGPVEHSRELDLYKNLIKTLVMGMKTIIWSINTDRLPRPQEMNPQGHTALSSAPHGFNGMRQDVLLLVGLFERRVQHHLPVIIEVCMKNTTIFRGLAGCKYKLLPTDLILMLLPCLYILLTMLEGPVREDVNDILLELCLSLFARLCSLLPYLSRLMKPLKLCLRGSDELVSLGLRTLAFWVETQNSDFLTLALWSHMRPVPYPWCGNDLHILGNFGGENGRFLKEPLTPEFEDNTEHGVVLVLTFLPPTSFMFPLDKFSNLSVAVAVNQRNHGVYIYYRKQALKFLPVCLLSQLNFPGSVTDVGQIPMQPLTLVPSSVYSSLCSSEPMEIKAGLGVKRETQLMAEKSIFKTLLTAAASVLRHVSLFILLPSSWTLANAVEVLGNEKQQQQHYMDQPASRSLLHYIEPIDSLLIFDRAGTLFLMDQSGKPRWSASFMLWFLPALFVVVVVVVRIIESVYKWGFALAPNIIEDDVIKMPDLMPTLSNDESVALSDDESVALSDDEAPAFPNIRKRLSPKKAPEEPREIPVLLNIRWGEFLHDKDGQKIKNLFIMAKTISKGGDFSVHEGFCQPRRAVAIKRIRLSQSKVFSIVNEIDIHTAVDKHSSIIRFYCYEFDVEFAYFGLEPWICNLQDLVIFSREKVTKKGKSRDYLEKPLTGMVLWERVDCLSPVVQKLMRDIASGLAHLHKLQVVFRDLKPENVVVIREGEKVTAKLTNMENSKCLSNRSHFDFPGSKGWKAPEQLCMDETTCAVDMFNFGCIIYYTITGGLNPFGYGQDHDPNVLANRYDISRVRNIPEAHDLISSLLKREPHLRPSASQVLLHPMFWSPDVRLSFLCEASDRVEYCEPGSTISNDLWKRKSHVMGNSWEHKIGITFAEYVKNTNKDPGMARRGYNFKRLSHLLRLIRNTVSHYRELPEDIKIIVGEKPEGLDEFFAGRFPKLLMEVHEVISQHCKEEKAFKNYF